MAGRDGWKAECFLLVLLEDGVKDERVFSAIPLSVRGDPIFMDHPRILNDYGSMGAFEFIILLQWSVCWRLAVRDSRENLLH